jgi:anaerobic magnesium-protoporphyrin IX monomethyl ester cyclase
MGAGRMQYARGSVDAEAALARSHAQPQLAPDVVLTSAYTASYPKAVALLRLAKEAVPGVVTGIGGVHAHFMYEEVLRIDGDVVDFVLRGEGERTTPDLVRCLDAGDDPGKVRGIAYR